MLYLRRHIMEFLFWHCSYIIGHGRERDQKANIVTMKNVIRIVIVVCIVLSAYMTAGSHSVFSHTRDEAPAHEQRGEQTAGFEGGFLIILALAGGYMAKRVYEVTRG